jgi:diaminohydroxyphosphoribosylaminopyrimidine deaminase/5-amino-6-(5-phosphoribosylamino)uracil reductase
MTSGTDSGADHRHMLRAVELAAGVRTTTSPNPWVGCVIVAADGQLAEGATQPPGGPHAEVVALAAAAAAGIDVTGATAYVTLEPCSHHGRTPPCADALAEAGVARVVVGIEDPDPLVAGRGLARLRDAGVEVTAGVAADVIAAQLAPYITHRTTGRPLVVLKLAASLDGRTGAPDGTSRWITGPEARADAHRLRAESDAVLVGAGTVRADDPALTVRHVAGRDPLRVVLGHAPPGAKVHPALEVEGDLAPSSTTSAAATCSSCWSRVAPAWPASSTGPGSSTPTSSTWRPPCSAGTTPPGCLPAPEPPRWPTSGAGASPVSSPWATTSASTCRLRGANRCSPASSRSSGRSTPSPGPASGSRPTS